MRGGHRALLLSFLPSPSATLRCMLERHTRSDRPAVTCCSLAAKTPGRHFYRKLVTMVGNISINAGGRDMYDALVADGRVVTRGIFFDTGSDRIRPESTPTLKMIGDMLKE